MTDEMRLTLARLPYEDKIKMVAALIEFSRQFKAAKALPTPPSSYDLSVPSAPAGLASSCFPPFLKLEA